MKNIKLCLSFLVLLVSFNTGIAMGAYYPVDFSASHNSTVQINPAFPQGNVTLGGVPFEIPVASINAWDSGNGTGQHGTFVLDINNIGIYGATDVYTLINTYWGRIGGGYMQIEVFGSDGAYYQKDLIGNDDIRQWSLFPVWTTLINNTTTTNVVHITPGKDNTPDVMDMQRFILPPDFLDETLTQIKVTSLYQTFVHGGHVSGVTVKAIPVPAAFWLAGVSMVWLVQARLRKSTK